MIKAQFTNTCEVCKKQESVLVADGIWYCPDCADQRIEHLTAQYNELLMAVGRKFPNETRHETALRYIRTIEHTASVGEAKEEKETR